MKTSISDDSAVARATSAISQSRPLAAVMTSTQATARSVSEMAFDHRYCAVDSGVTTTAERVPAPRSNSTRTPTKKNPIVVGSENTSTTTSVSGGSSGTRRNAIAYSVVIMTATVTI